MLQRDAIKLQSQQRHPASIAGRNVAKIKLQRPTYFGRALPPGMFFLAARLG
jgi:hypothetical protein